MSPFAHVLRVNPSLRLGSTSVQEASTWSRRTAVLTKRSVASSTCTRRAWSARTGFAALTICGGSFEKTSRRFAEFGNAIITPATSPATPSIVLIQTRRRRNRGDASGLLTPPAPLARAGRVRHGGGRARHPAVHDPLPADLLHVDVEDL